jgi:hypothetical protein
LHRPRGGLKAAKSYARYPQEDQGHSNMTLRLPLVGASHYQEKAIGLFYGQTDT